MTGNGSQCAPNYRIGRQLITWGIRVDFQTNGELLVILVGGNKTRISVGGPPKRKLLE